MKTEALILHLSQHFRENLQLDDLARVANLSKFHFHRLFTAEQGITPQQYLEKLKVEHAAHFMIVYPKASLQEVAFESGYTSPAVFSRSFKKKYAVSPSEFRIQNRIKFPAKKSKQKVPVQYLNAQTIYVTRVSLANIDKEYTRFIHHYPEVNEVFGFYLDVPIHTPVKDCRHFIGAENVGKLKQTLTIAAGYYTSVMVSGKFNALKEKLFQLKSAIDASGYQIDSLVGFERTRLPNDTKSFNYFSAERELFIKIKRT